MVVVDLSDVNAILNKLNCSFEYLGFEFHPFKVGWYNEFVQPAFKINYDENTLAFLIISTPKMFVNAFIPYLHKNEQHLSRIKDPLDECMIFLFSKVPEIFPENNVEVVYDFELHPNRKPKIVMQSAAHASGAAYYYQPRNVYLDTSLQQKKMFGVCIHPEFGGWFALRAVVFFKDAQCSGLERTPPANVVPSKQDQIKLFELYNFSWRDWKFRDIIPSKERYSDLQKKYFSTPPGSRESVIKEILETCCFQPSGQFINS